MNDLLAFTLIETGTFPLKVVTTSFLTSFWGSLVKLFFLQITRKIPWINIYAEVNQEKEQEMIGSVGQGDSTPKITLSEFSTSKELMEKELDARVKRKWSLFIITLNDVCLNMNGYLLTDNFRHSLKMYFDKVVLFCRWFWSNMIKDGINQCRFTPQAYVSYWIWIMFSNRVLASPFSMLKYSEMSKGVIKAYSSLIWSHTEH